MGLRLPRPRARRRRTAARAASGPKCATATTRRWWALAARAHGDRAAARGWAVVELV